MTELFAVVLLTVFFICNAVLGVEHYAENNHLNSNTQETNILASTESQAARTK